MTIKTTEVFKKSFKKLLKRDKFLIDTYEKLLQDLEKNPSLGIQLTDGRYKIRLKNYSNNRLLKGIEESNKVALNLKLNEKSKRIWFGNIKKGSNFKNRYELLGNLMNFGKKNKFYFLTNLNNLYS